MKFQTPYWFLSIVIILVIVISLISGGGVMPYSPNTLFPREFPYEGFHSLEYSTVGSNSALDTKGSYLIGGDTADCKKVYGFNGLFCKPYAADIKIDPFADTPGNTSCFGASSGLSNSKGGLCFSDAQKRLLLTRGGNQTGSHAEIGSGR